MDSFLSVYVLFEMFLLFWFFFLASPYTTSTPNINSVRNADSRGSLISTDSGNSIPERQSDKSNSLDKVKNPNQNKELKSIPKISS